ncbi:MAG: WYL domain-containing protein [Pseudomonadota bacterium]|uniref:WYL domain-containing protein n=1 Tax=Pseudomonas sp. TaxID=306 RepID=UPI00272CA5BA|nr:WYL domain-containing protein [Pseudomonas sp.]MDP9063170.1 WYL domain-containing protein [Pseudomonadota bacterium]MDQ3595965.1 WYL domain-containing protein [Pseudomonadota bacterium]
MSVDSSLFTIKTPLRRREVAVHMAERSRGSWFLQQRLRFIEARLFWSGRINRSDLMDHYSIHRSVASEDLAEYRRLAPRNAIYDRSNKVYRAGKRFLPIFGAPALQGLFAHSVLEDGLPGPRPSFELVPSPNRAADPGVARNVIAAAQTGFALKVFYRSMETPAGHWRWIEPHCLVSDGHRWHVRAYCRERGGFRDFVLGRLEIADETAPRTVDPITDAQWHEFVEVEIRPHHKLNRAQAELVAADFGMANGCATFDCRRALLWYVLVNLGLDEERSPPRQLIELTDPELRQYAGFH